MRLSIFCVRDYLSIFYIGIFHDSSVLINPFSGRLFACGKLEFSYAIHYFNTFFNCFTALALVLLFKS